MSGETDIRTTTGIIVAYTTSPADDEGKANAYLIAVAPEMLAVLRDVLDELSSIFTGGLPYTVERDELHTRLENLIDKARGER
jgi:hypothetical protein